MNAYNIDFTAEEFDQLFARWAAGQLSEAERREWSRILSQDSRFREEFCEWMKSLRAPGLAARAHLANQTNDDSKKGVLT